MLRPLNTHLGVFRCGEVEVGRIWGNFRRTTFVENLPYRVIMLTVFSYDSPINLEHLR